MMAILLWLLVSRLFSLVGAPVVTSPTSLMMSPILIQPKRCIEPRPLLPVRITRRSKNFHRIDLDSLVEPVGEGRRSSTLGCARRCARRLRCDLFIVDPAGGICQLFVLSLAGTVSNCTAGRNVCYMKLC